MTNREDAHFSRRVEQADGSYVFVSYPHKAWLWRHRLCARVVLYSIALGTLNKLSQNDCDRAFWWWFERPEDELIAMVTALEEECREKRLHRALMFAATFDDLGMPAQRMLSTRSVDEMSGGKGR